MQKATETEGDKVAAEFFNGKKLSELTPEELANPEFQEILIQRIEGLDKEFRNHPDYADIKAKLVLSSSEMSENRMAMASVPFMVMMGLASYGVMSNINEINRLKLIYESQYSGSEKSFSDFVSDHGVDIAFVVGDIGLTALEIGAALKLVRGVKGVSVLVDNTKNIAADGKIFFEKGKDLLGHFQKHANGIRSTLGLDTLTTKQYIDNARKVINEGTYVKSINAHVKKVVKNDGKVRYLITGLKNKGKNISTFHVKRPKDLQKLLNKSGSDISLDLIK